MTTDLTQQIQRVREQRESRRADAAERYHKLIIASADGEELSPEAAAVTLEDSGSHPRTWSVTRRRC